MTTSAASSSSRGVGGALSLYDDNASLDALTTFDEHVEVFENASLEAVSFPQLGRADQHPTAAHEPRHGRRAGGRLVPLVPSDFLSTSGNENETRTPCAEAAGCSQ